ncbi:hypothetical protein F5Y03DRAFT_389045 [Xylaria venustula]|nr:hypothetical protein F5Y03DRAFT_389045 [Xylaria venustula]
MTGLLQLPNEVLAIIWDELDAQGFSALRLASKYASSATLSAFTRQYFKTRYVMLSRLSLENLVEVARHPVFGPAVRTLEICTDHFHQFPDSYYTHAAPVDEEQIIMPGLARAYITQALIALTKAEAVVISNMHRPWGALVHGRQTGRPPTNAVEDFEAVPFIGRVLRIALTAIATSGAALRSLAVTTDDLLTFIGMFRQLTQLDLVITPDRFGPQVNRLKELVPKLQLSNLQCFGLYRVYCSVQDLAILITRHKATLQSVTLSLFALICLVLSYQAEHKDGQEEFEHDFDVGGNHENWTTAIQAVEASRWPL